MKMLREIVQATAHHRQDGQPNNYAKLDADRRLLDCGNE
jgi:hypothetical protein